VLRARTVYITSGDRTSEPRKGKAVDWTLTIVTETGEYDRSGTSDSVKEAKRDILEAIDSIATDYESDEKEQRG
jgi:hypothetical protein